MSWSRERSTARILEFLKSTPHTSISLRQFDQASLNARRAAIAKAKAEYRQEELIFNVGRNEAILVEGVHIYVQLLDYHDAVAEQGRETEGAHRKLLRLLHTHYSGSDFVAEDFEAQRVDYHGPRMHAVIVTPIGPEFAFERARRAYAFAETLKRTIEGASNVQELGVGTMRVRIGMDSGPAVAVNSGRGSEQEPLFLGNPANYAAKLADGDEPGIFMSNRVREQLQQRTVGTILGDNFTEEKRTNVLGNLMLDGPGQPRLTVGLPDLAGVTQRAWERMQANAKSTSANPSFVFHQHTPPLRSIKFVDLAPANSIRMDMVSLFADIDGFTRYVGQSIQSGQIQQMVSNLHVLRAELAASLRDDFHGRKVRFIGDCIHGLVAEGTSVEVNKADTTRQAILAAGGLRSSFENCKRILQGVEALGLAIGLDIGATPVTRLGLRGDRSVRCATSKAVTLSEKLQALCNGKQTAVSQAFYDASNQSVKNLFTAGGIVDNLDYDAVAQMLAPAQVIRRGDESATAKPYTDGSSE